MLKLANAAIWVIKVHYMPPAAVATIGSPAHVPESRLNYRRDPALKG